MSGWKGAFGIAAESAYGTYTAINRWYEVEKTSDLKRRFNPKQGGGLAAGRLGNLVTRYVRITEDAGGTIKTDIVHKSMGLLLNHVFGGTVTPVQQGGTIAWLHTFPLADNLTKSFSAQKGAPNTAGTVHPYTYLGCKITKATFECPMGGIVTLDAEVDARASSEAQGLVAPTIVTGLKPRTFRELTFKLGAIGAEASVGGVRTWTVTVDRGQDVERYHAGNAGLKSEPIMNVLPKVTGKVTVDLVNKADFADRYASGAPVSLIIEHVGPLIASTFFETFRLKLPVVILTEGEPGADGPDVVKTDYMFEAFIDDVVANQLVTCEYMTTDSVL